MGHGKHQYMAVFLRLVLFTGFRDDPGENDLFKTDETCMMPSPGLPKYYRTGTFISHENAP